MRKGKESSPSPPTELRERAEGQLGSQTLQDPQAYTEAESQRLVHELKVHQIELEMQNEALSQSRDDAETNLEKYTDLYDFSPAGYFTIDRNGIVRAANLTGSRFVKTERAKLIGLPFVTFIAQASRSVFSVFLGKIFSGDGEISCEVALTLSANSSLIVQLGAIASRSDKECRIAVIDITRNKQIEEQLLISEKIYRTIGEAIDYGIWICAPDGRNIYASESFLTLVGFTQERCSNFGWCDALHPDDADRTIAAWKECVRTEGVWDMELRFLGVDGQWHDILARGLPVKNSRGEIIHWAGINLDISRIKKTELELRKAHDTLDEKIKERTEELSRTNIQLTLEIEDRKNAENSLQEAYAEIKQLNERFEAENIYLHREIAQEHNFGEIIGQCQALADLFVRIKQVAPMNATVLLLGETGTGKGLVARAIHSNGSRKDRPMITVNCTALPANLIESELFGRERGAFTGAHDRQIGRFELAHTGTIFLDEIGEMPIDLQSKLLRVIQDGEFERLGSPRTIKVDVRIIAATNRNLEDEIRKGTFREDLFYRLNVFPLHIPPLRERTEDIPELVQYFIHKFNKKMNKKIESVAKSSLNNLMEYHWPGNVRELESVIERAVITSQGTKLQILDSFVTSGKNGNSDQKRVKMLDELERDHILQVLQTNYWRIEGKNGAAVLLGINPSTLRARMRKFGITRENDNA